MWCTVLRDRVYQRVSGAGVRDEERADPCRHGPDLAEKLDACDGAHHRDRDRSTSDRSARDAGGNRGGACASGAHRNLVHLPQLHQTKHTHWPKAMVE